VDLEGTLENARLKECLCGMEGSPTRQEGEDNENSQGNANVQKRQKPSAQPTPCRKVLFN
jgi:hypothetical protein